MYPLCPVLADILDSPVTQTNTCLTFSLLGLRAQGTERFENLPELQYTPDCHRPWCFGSEESAGIGRLGLALG